MKHTEAASSDDAAVKRPPAPQVVVRGIRGRLAMLLTSVVMVLSLTVGSYLVESQGRRYLEDARERAGALLRTLAVPSAMALAEDKIELLDGYLNELVASGAKVSGLQTVALLDHEGQRVAHTGLAQATGAQHTEGTWSAEKTSDNHVLASASSSDEALWWRYRGGSGKTFLVVSMPAVAGYRWGTLVARFDLTSVVKQVLLMRWLLAGLTLLLGIVLVVLIYFSVSRSVLEPIQALGRTTRSILAGNLGARVNVQSLDELGQLALTFNKMADELQEYTSSLETKVAGRTEEVRKKNRELEEVNCRLSDAVDELARMARTDELTGLANRRAFKERFESEVRRSSRTGYPLAYLGLDIDHFKRVNDTYGHPTGDKVLKKLAEIGMERLRTTDIMARVGGEEFAILLLDSDRKAALAVAELLRKSVEEHTFSDTDDQPIGPLTVSCGLAICPADAKEAKELASNADVALYAAKEGGRNRIVPWTAELNMHGEEG
jgi:diguanylate cyclase (GGDEF)-like protein